MEKTRVYQTDDAPHPFIQRHQADVIGVLHGWDRLRLQGTLRTLYYRPVMERYLFKARVLWKDYKTYVTGITERIKQSAASLASEHQRPMIYLPSCKTDKEAVALRAQQERPVRQGLVAVLSCVEPCRTWFARGQRAIRQASSAGAFCAAGWPTFTGWTEWLQDDYPWWPVELRLTPNEPARFCRARPAP